MTEAPNPVDVHVGQRVRLRRKDLGVSQSALADGIGLTFQQVQKYERGANRISASVLFKIARTLNCDANYFFAGLTGADAGAARVRAGPDWADALAADNQGRSIGAAFLQIRGPGVRRALAKLAQALAGEIDDVEAEQNEMPATERRQGQ